MILDTKDFTTLRVALIIGRNIFERGAKKWKCVDGDSSHGGGKSSFSGSLFRATSVAFALKSVDLSIYHF